MTKRGSTQQAGRGKPARDAANDDALHMATSGLDGALASFPANDNPVIDNLPPCVAVTDDEVRLLHRYLGQQILALFG